MSSGARTASEQGWPEPWKPIDVPSDWVEKRVKDPDLLREFRMQHIWEPCEVCELRAGIHVHHRVHRSQGGGDEWENLQWLCGSCHDQAHGIRSVW